MTERPDEKTLRRAVHLALELSEMEFVGDSEINQGVGVTTIRVTMQVPTLIWREAEGRQAKRTKKSRRKP